jgi:integrase
VPCRAKGRSRFGRAERSSPSSWFRLRCGCSSCVKAAALDGLRIHDLRHTAVALWIAAGASPKEVAALAGHTSVSFTLDRYGHLYPDSYATLRDRLDALHSSAQERDAEVIDLPSTARRQR